jgi:uncharacterized protein YjiS (DUF1127 family)
MAMSTIFVHSLSNLTGVSGSSAVAIPAKGVPASPARRLFATLVTWQQRYELRRHLLELDDRLLVDMGLTQEDARREAARPFWRE